MKMTILIVDDSTLIRRAIGRYLSPLGFEVVAEASNGLQALERFSRTEPDLVTLDITMPGMDGLECLAAMVALRPTVRVVVISALADPATGLKALKLGARSFLPKPFTEDQLAQEILRVAGVSP